MMQLLALEHFSSNAQAFSMRIWGQLAMSIDRKLMRSAATSAAGTGLEEGLGGGDPCERSASGSQHCKGRAALWLGRWHALSAHSREHERDASCLGRWHACWAMLSLFGEETIQFHHFSAPIASPTLARVPSDIKRQLESLERHSLHQAQDGSPPSNIKRDRQPQQPQEWPQE
jgi:hypothetical protein